MASGGRDNRVKYDAATKAEAVRRYLAGDAVTDICHDLAMDRNALRKAVLAAGHQMRQPGSAAPKTASGICLECNLPFTYQFRSGRRSLCEDCLDGRNQPKRTYPTRKCPDCGKTMRRAPNASRCLSCQRTRQRGIRRTARLNDGPTERTTTCDRCGDQFTYTKPPGRGGTRRLCDDCDRERKQTWAEARRQPLRAAYGLKPRPCAACGEDFQPTTSTHVYCSRACGARAARSRKASKTGRPLGIRSCSQCGTDFHQRGARQRFCSDACRYESFKAGRYVATAHGFTYRGVAVSITAARVSQMRRDFGLTPGEYEAMWKRQRGRCAVCRAAMTDKPHPHIDHDPKTMRVRGLLCVSCNMALGYLKDDPQVIDRAAAYLRDSRNKGGK